MKIYGETVFDVAYLLTALIVGLWILTKAQNKSHRLMGIATLVLGCGDAFHLVPRMLDYFIDKDFSAALGIGKLITSVTMTVFYVLLYYIYLHIDTVSENRRLTGSIWGLSAVRIALCLFPQNRWLTNDGPLLWGILRNIPFLVLGAVIVVLFFRIRKQTAAFKNIWLYVTLSFIFYIPVVIGAAAVPMLGMMMLPKTVCYVLIIFVFRKKVITDNA